MTLAAGDAKPEMLVPPDPCNVLLGLVRRRPPSALLPRLGSENWEDAFMDRNRDGEKNAS